MRENSTNKSTGFDLKDIMEDYGQKLLRYCHNILCNYHDAQDAIQSAFIKAYYKQSSFKQGMELSPWLYKIAYNTCIDILRKKKYSQIFITPSNKDREDYIPENIENALMTLSALDRALVFGRVIEERPYDELSEILGKSPSNLRKRYERARHKLIAQLADDYPYYAKQEVKNEQEL